MSADRISQLEAKMEQFALDHVGLADRVRELERKLFVLSTTMTTAAAMYQAAIIPPGEGAPVTAADGQSGSA